MFGGVHRVIIILGCCMVKRKRREKKVTKMQNRYDDDDDEYSQLVEFRTIDTCAFISAQLQMPFAVVLNSESSQN